MPPLPFIILLAAVIFASALTLWLLWSGGPTVMLIALPAFMIAAVALKVLRK